MQLRIMKFVKGVMVKMGKVELREELLDLDWPENCQFQLWVNALAYATMLHHLKVLYHYEMNN